MTTYWEDPAGVDVTKVNEGIDYNSNGSCITYGNYRYHYYWYSPSGWGLHENDWRFANRCDLEASSSYVHFQNGVFCSGFDVDTYYDRTSIHGYPDGGLEGFWNSYNTGATCRNLLGFHAQLIRQI